MNYCAGSSVLPFITVQETGQIVMFGKRGNNDDCSSSDVSTIMDVCRRICILVVECCIPSL